MRRGRIFFYLAFIIILALVAVFVVWQRFLQPANTGPNTVVETPIPKVNVVIVTQRVPRGAVLEANVLSTIPWQENALIPGMFQSTDNVVGRQARFDLEAGIPLTSGMLVDSANQLSTTGSLAALSIPKGMVAVSIPVSRLSAVSYAPQSGDHVNVIVTMSFVDLDTDFQTLLPNKTGLVIGPGTPSEGALPNLTAQIQGSDSPLGKAAQDDTLGAPVYNQPSEPQRPRLASQTLLQDAVVLRMGDFNETSTTAAPTPVAPGEAQPTAEVTPTPVKQPDLVTLIVTPQDAVTLNYLMSLGSGAKLTLALRASGDDSRVETEAVTLQFLLDQYNIPVPVKLPYGTQPRVDQLLQPTLTNDVVATPQP
jgi:Flp pilus assembly protein CpaB